MTGPDVLVSGGEHEVRRLPRWLRRTAASVVVVGLLVAGLARLSADERRRERLERVADRVAVQLSIGELGVGVDASVVLGVTVIGTGAPLRVDRPVVRPSELATVMVIGAPRQVARDVGGQLRLRLHPDCTRVLAARRLDVDVPLTPASGHRHVRRLSIPDGPEMLRRACGYLPPDEALVAALTGPRLDGPALRVDVRLRNDGRRALIASGPRSPGLQVLAPGAPVTVPAGGEVTLPVALRVVECRVSGLLTLVATDEDGAVGEVALPYDGATESALTALRARACG